MPTHPPLDQLLAKIDRVNRDDPHTETIDGAIVPHELADARRITAWVARLAPDASEALQIAARGQHIRRWTIPRTHYPAGRAGYLKWRETLKRFHADTVAALMREEAWPEETIARAQTLIMKRGLGADPEVQVLEDALCLVFLEREFVTMRRDTPEPTMGEVVRKTWNKMSPRAQSLALALPLPDADRAWLAHVLAS